MVHLTEFPGAPEPIRSRRAKRSGIERPAANTAAPANFIHAWRRRRGLTQAELAVAVGIDRTQLTRIERGERRYVQPVIEAIAVVLDCTPGDLISRHPDHSSEIETLYRSLTDEDRARALAVLRAMFAR